MKLCRIQVLHELGRHREVEAILGDLQSQFEKPAADYDVRFWGGDRASSMELRRFKLLQGLVEEEQGRKDSALARWNDAIAIEANPKMRTEMFSHTGDATALYALAGRFTRGEALPQARRLLGTATPIVRSVSGMLTEESVTDTIVAMWSSDAGKETLRDMSWGRIPWSEKGLNTLGAFLFQFGWDRLLGGDAAPGAAQDFHRFTLHGIRWFSTQEEVTPAKLLQMALCWNGNSGVLGWRGLAPQLKPESRGMLAYLLAKRSIVIGRIDDAKDYIAVAVENLSEDSGIKRHAVAERSLLENGTAALWIGNRCARAVELEVTHEGNVIPARKPPADGTPACGKVAGKSEVPAHSRPPCHAAWRFATRFPRKYSRKRGEETFPAFRIEALPCPAPSPRSKVAAVRPSSFSSRC